MKKVSVIVPVYNVEKYLDRCLESLVNQTLSDIEIIVINDGSKDSSLDIINKYLKNYKDKMKLIDQKNCGISVARNNGIKIAQGKYLGFVDSDDFVDVSMFEKLYNSIEKSKSDIVVCNYLKYQDKNNILKIDVVKNVHSDNIYKSPDMINSIDYAPWNKLYKRELFDNIEFPVNKKYEDLNTILKVFLNAKSISTLNSYLYFYRVNELGETLTINNKVGDILFIIDDLLKYSKSQDKYYLLEDEFKKMAVDKLFYYLILSYQLKDKHYIMEFRNNIINLLNKNFKNWKKYFIFNSDFDFTFKLIAINNHLFKLYISRKKFYE